MRFHKFLGGNKEELFFEETNIKFLVHKSLINESTRDMLQHFLISLEAPAGVRAYSINGVYIFEPVECEIKTTLIDNENFLWFIM